MSAHSFIWKWVHQLCMHQSLIYSQFREGDSFPYVCDDVICLVELKLTVIVTHILPQTAIWLTGCVINLNTHYRLPDTILVLASFDTSVSRLKFWVIYVISPTLDNECNYSSMLELKLNHASKIGPWMNDWVIISLKHKCWIPFAAQIFQMSGKSPRSASNKKQFWSTPISLSHPSIRLDKLFGYRFNET